MKPFRFVVTAIIIFFAGIIIGHFGKALFTVNLKREIGLGELLTFTNTLIFAYLIQNYLAKRFGDTRAEKDHIISMLNESLEHLKSARDVFLYCYYKNTIPEKKSKELLTHLRIFNNSIGQIEGFLFECGYEPTSRGCDSIIKKYFQYKSKITGGNFPSEPYSPSTFNAAEVAFSALTSSIHKKRIEINKK